MKPIHENLPTLNGSRTQGTQPLSRYSQTSTADLKAKASQLRDLIQQSFEIFNVYGKQPEAVVSIVQGFMMILEPYEIGDIQAAFKKWMGDNAAMPTPADIKGLVERQILDRTNAAKYADFVKPEARMPEQPIWEREKSNLSPEALNGLRGFLTNLPEQVGRNYCGYTFNYDEIMKGE